MFVYVSLLLPSRRYNNTPMGHQNMSKLEIKFCLHIINQPWDSPLFIYFVLFFFSYSFFLFLYSVFFHLLWTRVVTWGTPGRRKDHKAQFNFCHTHYFIYFLFLFTSGNIQEIYLLIVDVIFQTDFVCAKFFYLFQLDCVFRRGIIFKRVQTGVNYFYYFNLHLYWLRMSSGIFFFFRFLTVMWRNKNKKRWGLIFIDTLLNCYFIFTFIYFFICKFRQFLYETWQTEAIAKTNSTFVSIPTDTRCAISIF